MSKKTKDLKSRRQELINNGFCPICKKYNEDRGVTCDICLRKRREKQRVKNNYLQLTEEQKIILEKIRYTNDYSIDFLERLVSYIIINHQNNCWEWSGILSRYGYGEIRCHPHRRLSVHRLIYRLVNGSIDCNKPYICHSCDNPKCCNPNHLYAGTQQDNMNDMLRKQRGNLIKNARLNNKDIQFIRHSTKTHKELSQIFNISQTHISNIKNYKSYKHIKEGGE